MRGVDVGRGVGVARPVPELVHVVPTSGAAQQADLARGGVCSIREFRKFATKTLPNFSAVFTSLSNLETVVHLDTNI